MFNLSELLFGGSRRIRIAAECARLESVYRETYRGFKSLILRHHYSPGEVFGIEE
jgi:hypothetical protein